MKKRKKYIMFDFLLYVVVIAFFCSFLFIYYFNIVIGPGLIRCAEDEMRRLATLVINNSFEKYLKEQNVDSLLEISKNQDDDINLIKYNTKMMNELTSDIVSILENDLYYMSIGKFDKLDFILNNISDNYYEMLNDGVLFTVSMGSATGNRLLANIGPKIPLNLSVVGDVMSGIDTKVTEYGLNNALIEVFIDIEVTLVIHMPFLSRKIIVKNTIPLTMEMIQGRVPGYFYGNK